MTSPEMLKLAAEKGMESVALSPMAGDIPTFTDKTFSAIGSELPRFEKDASIPKFTEDDRMSSLASEGALSDDGDDNTDHDGDEQNALDKTNETNSDVLEEVSDDSSEKNGECLSSYEERLNQTPAEGDRGNWTGVRGESKYVPTDDEVKEVLAEYDLDGIHYADGTPDFSKCSEATVEIDSMSSDRPKNFLQCDEKCAGQWNSELYDNKSDWTSRDVADWRRENHYSWHECNDCKTCQLVPTKVNDYFGHLGGIGECNIAEGKQEGHFDE